LNELSKSGILPDPGNTRTYIIKYMNIGVLSQVETCHGLKPIEAASR